MADPLRILARVANNAAKISAEDLERLADEQQLNLDEKQRLRRALDAYNEMVASGIVTYDELNDLRLLGEYLGFDWDWNNWDGDSWDRDWDVTAADGSEHKYRQSDYYLDLNAEGDKGQKNRDALENNIKKQIESKQEEVDENQQEVQFEIQVATGDMQNDRNIASQAEKRREQIQGELRRNWNVG